MRLISHRGNLDGPIPGMENDPGYIEEAIKNGYDVEIDVRLIPMGMYLGHDILDYKITLQWLLDRRDSLWVHAKDFESLDLLLSKGLRVFYHQREKHTIIGNTQLIWSHDITEAGLKSIIPLIGERDIAPYMELTTDERMGLPCHGICSDFVDTLKGGKK